eukprot:m.87904 g.87904  ORF g.87904 m.87904 type:complete len:544 (-) comp21429_c0_seq2:36-1667(-)
MHLNDDMHQIKVTRGGPEDNLCLDFNEGSRYLQGYKCLDDANQHWLFNSSHIQEAYDTTKACLGLKVSGCQVPTPPPPPPPGPFCAQYHPIHSPNVYDPSGPIQTSDGTWHVFEDQGGWSHWTSRDLIRWQLRSPSTGFSGLTGSVAATPSGMYAFWPSSDQSSILTAVATDGETLNTWQQRGPAIHAPAFSGKNFRDPLRALNLNEKWYVGVGCNNNSMSADVCLFQATNDTLASFTSVGALFSTNITFGQMDDNIVWKNESVRATMMECPDVFPLGDKYMIIGSLFATNQWWIGTIAGDPPRFTAEKVGLMDYGNGYAAKTGTTMVQTPTARRLVFSFTGWKEPSADPSCGRFLTIPRDLTLGDDGKSPRIRPIPEIASLRANTSMLNAKVEQKTVPLVIGSLAEIQVNCTFSQPPTTGVVATRVLGTADGVVFTEIGYNFGQQMMYANHSRCCATPNDIVQTAPVPIVNLDGQVNFTVLVDGGMIESFLNGLVTITPLVAPDANQGPPETRINSAINTADGVECVANGWKLGALPPAPPP